MNSPLLGPAYTAYILAQGLSMFVGGAIGLFAGYGVMKGSHRFGVTDNYLHPYPAGW